VRALFLLLLLANLLFAGWSLWIAGAPSATGLSAPLATGPASIRLVRELPSPPVPSAGSGLADLDDASLTCVSAGPYLERAEAESAAARLADLGYAVRLREARDEVNVGQWVRIEGLATPEDAANVQAALRAAGLVEAYVVTDERAGTVVSLGVFSNGARAAEAAGAARAAGFEPRVVDATRIADVTWVDVDRQASGGLPSSEQLKQPDPGRLPKILLRRCPEGEPATGAGATVTADAAAADTPVPTPEAAGQRQSDVPR